MDRRVTEPPVTTQMNLAVLSGAELMAFRRNLLGVLSIVEVALAQHGLTFPPKERKG